MKKFGKRLMAMAMAVAVAGAALILPPAEETFGAEEGILVSNGDLTESEPNNTKSKANALKANVAMHGSIAEGGDTDYYSYTVESNGYYYFQFENIDGQENKTVTFYNSANKKLYWINGTGRSRYFDFAKGTTVYVAVSGVDYYKGSYTLTPVQEADSAWAVEPNNNKKKATKVKRNQTKYATIGYFEDVDFFLYKATKSGKTKLSFVVEDDEVDRIGYGWNVYIYNAKNKQLTHADLIQVDTELTFKAKKNAKYYIKVVSSASYAGAYGVKYSLKVK